MQHETTPVIASKKTKQKQKWRRKMGFGAEVENFGRTESLMKKKKEEEKKGQS